MKPPVSLVQVSDQASVQIVHTRSAVPGEAILRGDVGGTQEAKTDGSIDAKAIPGGSCQFKNRRRRKTGLQSKRTLCEVAPPTCMKVLSHVNERLAM